MSVVQFRLINELKEKDQWSQGLLLGQVSKEISSFHYKISI